MLKSEDFFGGIFLVGELKLEAALTAADKVNGVSGMLIEGFLISAQGVIEVFEALGCRIEVGEHDGGENE